MNRDSNLSRFLSAQENIYPQVIKELQAGKKTSHWMWFIFPQIEGLGSSSTSKFYSIKNIEEAKKYLQHPVLGGRLLECANAVLHIKGKSAYEIFGSPDDLKLNSCMTLFSYVAPEQKVFAEVLVKYFAGKKDEKTINILNQ